MPNRSKEQPKKKRGRPRKVPKQEQNQTVADERQLLPCDEYVNGECSKGVLCIYMHKEFPCPIYYMDFECRDDKNCKFLHDKPLPYNILKAFLNYVKNLRLRDLIPDAPNWSFKQIENVVMKKQIKLWRKQNSSFSSPNETLAEHRPIDETLSFLTKQQLSHLKEMGVKNHYDVAMLSTWQLNVLEINDRMLYSKILEVCLGAQMFDTKPEIENSFLKSERTKVEAKLEEESMVMDIKEDNDNKPANSYDMEKIQFDDYKNVARLPKSIFFRVVSERNNCLLKDFTLPNEIRKKEIEKFRADLREIEKELFKMLPDPNTRLPKRRIVYDLKDGDEIQKDFQVGQKKQTTDLDPLDPNNSQCGSYAESADALSSQKELNLLENTKKSEHKVEKKDIIGIKLEDVKMRNCFVVIKRLPDDEIEQYLAKKKKENEKQKTKTLNRKISNRRKTMHAERTEENVVAADKLLRRRKLPKIKIESECECTETETLNKNTKTKLNQEHKIEIDNASCETNALASKKQRKTLRNKNFMLEDVKVGNEKIVKKDDIEEIKQSSWLQLEEDELKREDKKVSEKGAAVDLIVEPIVLRIKELKRNAEQKAIEKERRQIEKNKSRKKSIDTKEEKKHKNYKNQLSSSSSNKINEPPIVTSNILLSNGGEPNLKIENTKDLVKAAPAAAAAPAARVVKSAVENNSFAEALNESDLYRERTSWKSIKRCSSPKNRTECALIESEKCYVRNPFVIKRGIRQKTKSTEEAIEEKLKKTEAISDLYKEYVKKAKIRRLSILKTEKRSESVTEWCDKDKNNVHNNILKTLMKPEKVRKYSDDDNAEKRPFKIPKLQSSSAQNKQQQEVSTEEVFISDLDTNQQNSVPPVTSTPFKLTQLSLKETETDNVRKTELKSETSLPKPKIKVQKQKRETMSLLEKSTYNEDILDFDCSDSFDSDGELVSEPTNCNKENASTAEFTNDDDLCNWDEEFMIINNNSQQNEPILSPIKKPMPMKYRSSTPIAAYKSKNSAAHISQKSIPSQQTKVQQKPEMIQNICTQMQYIPIYCPIERCEIHMPWELKEIDIPPYEVNKPKNLEKLLSKDYEDPRLMRPTNMTHISFNKVYHQTQNEKNRLHIFRALQNSQWKNDVGVAKLLLRNLVRALGDYHARCEKQNFMGKFDIETVENANEIILLLNMLNLCVNEFGAILVKSSQPIPLCYEFKNTNNTFQHDHHSGGGGGGGGHCLNHCHDFDAQRLAPPHPHPLPPPQHYPPEINLNNNSELHIQRRLPQLPTFNNTFAHYGGLNKNNDSICAGNNSFSLYSNTQVVPNPQGFLNPQGFSNPNAVLNSQAFLNAQTVANSQAFLNAQAILNPQALQNPQAVPILQGFPNPPQTFPNRLPNFHNKNKNFCSNERNINGGGSARFPPASHSLNKNRQSLLKKNLNN